MDGFYVKYILCTENTLKLVNPIIWLRSLCVRRRMSASLVFSDGAADSSKVPSKWSWQDSFKLCKTPCHALSSKASFATET